MSADSSTNDQAIEDFVLDVRPILADGGEPFGLIMETVAGLQEGQSLHLIAPFEPTPLQGVLGAQGFSYVANEVNPAEWHVRFSPAG